MNNKKVSKLTNQDALEWIKELKTISAHEQKCINIIIESLEQDQETKEKMWAKQLNECEECEVINNEWVDVRDRLPSEDKDYFVTIESTIDFRKRYYIVLAHWEKSYTDKSVDGWWYCVGWNRAEEQHLYDITKDVVAWKKVDPYERKERE